MRIEDPKISNIKKSSDNKLAYKKKSVKVLRSVGKWYKYCIEILPYTIHGWTNLGALGHKEVAVNLHPICSLSIEQSKNCLAQSFLFKGLLVYLL